MSAMERGSTRLRLAMATLVALACVGGGMVAWGARDPERRATVPQDTTSAEEVVLSHDDSAPVPTGPVKERKLRSGEQRTTLQMSAAYTPSPPTGTGTDDYRCFLLDPDLPEDAWLTGTQILPGNPEVVHHVILFRVDDDDLAAAEAEDAASPEPGWTCFGGMGLEGEFNNVDDAAWLGAWAPGGRETVARKGYGVSLDSDTRIVMQVHYNLLKGDAPDLSATQIRWTPKAGSDIRSVHTTLLPAPVEMPCRSEHALGSLCDRDASIEDAKERFGDGAGQLANLLHLLCGTNIYATQTTSCTRKIASGDDRPRRGRPHAPARPVAQDRGQPGNARGHRGPRHPAVELRRPGLPSGSSRCTSTPATPCGSPATTPRSCATCCPAFDGTQEKYVVWGEGTTDEMCLGILQVVFDDEV